MAGLDYCLVGIPVLLLLMWWLRHLVSLVLSYPMLPVVTSMWCLRLLGWLRNSRLLNPPVRLLIGREALLLAWLR